MQGGLKGAHYTSACPPCSCRYNIKAAHLSRKASSRVPRILRDVKVKGLADIANGHALGRTDLPDPLNIEACTLPSGLVDFYALLQVGESATSAEMKAAYRALQKRCHPDIMGQERGHEMSVLLNEAYTILSDEHLRMLYNIDLKETLWEQEQGFSNQPLSEWLPHSAPHLAKNWDPEEARALFVDENTCIGCKQCLWCAANTFGMEPEFGRARALRQWADCEDDLHAAVNVCPVQCIHWVDRWQLPILEHVMQRQMKERMNVGIMMASNSQGPNVNVFHAAATLQRHEAQRKEAHVSWRQVYNYSKQQEEAMLRARAQGINGYIYVSGLTAFGKLVALFAAAAKVLRDHFSADPASEQHFTSEPIPFEQSLVRIRIDDNVRR